MNKTMRWSLLCWGVACGTTCGTMLSAQAQPEAVPNLEDIPENYRAPLPAQVEKAAGKKSVDADALAPVTGGGQNRAGDLPATVQSKAAVAASVKGVQAGQGLEEGGAARIVLPRLLSGEMTLQDAMKSGVLNVGDIEWVLSRGLWPWGTFGPTPNEPLRRDIAQMWIAANGDKLKDGASLSKLPQTLRLWVGDYLMSEVDARAVPVLESVVQELTKKAPLKGEAEADLAFQVAERLAWFYGLKEQHEKVAHSWSLVPQLLEDQGWWQADAGWLESQAWLVVGDEARAQQAQKHISSKNHPFFYGASILDRAFIAYQKHNDAQARRLGAQAATFFDGSGHDLRVGFASQARTMLAMVDRWEKEPILLARKEWRLPVAAPSAATSGASATFSILTRVNSPLSVESDTTEVKVRVEEAQPLNQADFFRLQVLRKMKVEVSSSFVERGGRATVKVRSSQHPGHTTQLTITAPERPAVAVSPLNAFLGVVSPGGQAEKSVRVEARTPFHITGVEAAQDGGVSVKWDKKAAATHTIVVRAQGREGKQGEVRRGTVRLSTDLPNKEVIEVPYLYTVR